MSKKISRRQVLKTGAGTLLAAALPKNIFAAEIVSRVPVEKNPVRFEALSNHFITHGGLQLVGDTRQGGL